MDLTRGAPDIDENPFGSTTRFSKSSKAFSTENFNFHRFDQVFNIASKNPPTKFTKPSILFLNSKLRSLHKPQQKKNHQCLLPVPNP
ncbi:LOW QUALITY PROTEIN: hypothetical protein TorRG33x02_049370 [Trema orientale]|uniref:Uncharacterized protein n=1 Tax=Trema orientale TaxID=63057 RepID=A0A2P5FNN2_TREOI|nr:LOW QUALITY PROTEIN: hypothetical protein TorRG33x02_049370 [Trema orientale]